LIGPEPAQITAEDPLVVLSASVTALLGPERANNKQIRSAATDVIEFLRDGEAAALRVIDTAGSRQ
jgi:hypothetical protein